MVFGTIFEFHWFAGHSGGLGAWLISGGWLGSAPPLVVLLIPYLSLLNVILGTGAVMAYMPPVLHL